MTWKRFTLPVVFLVLVAFGALAIWSPVFRVKVPASFSLNRDSLTELLENVESFSASGQTTLTGNFSHDGFSIKLTKRRLTSIFPYHQKLKLTQGQLLLI